MPTNLNRVPDHPANLLAVASEEYGVPAAGMLTIYEQEKGVTFAALDNAALARVREAYNTEGLNHGIAYDESGGAVGDFVSAVSDLLGLAD